MKIQSTCIQLTPGLVINNGGDKKCNSILVACHRLFPWPRNQSHVDHTPKHFEQFFVNLFGSPLRKEWIDLKNGVRTPFLRSIHSLRRGLPKRFTKNCSKCFGVWSTWLWLRGHGNSLWQATRIELHFLSPPLLITRPGVSWMQVDWIFTTSVR